mmetsp:Transcript_23537/g.38464  ORF Transcript_23537/g.38464 Transcript_23537/m.38464 type:complete len:87 (+) Transcript_23537:282-542(+)
MLGPSMGGFGTGNLSQPTAHASHHLLARRLTLEVAQQHSIQHRALLQLRHPLMLQHLAAVAAFGTTPSTMAGATPGAAGRAFGTST